jgi:enterochelin esterase family protein
MLLLHGTDQDNQHWLELGIKTTLEAGLAESPPRFAPMVLVMPEGGDLQSEARFEIGAAYEDLILRELLPEIEATLCVQKDSRGRGIAGIGRGAFWAYSIALRHPEVFSIIAGHSPWFLPDNAPITHNPLALAERAIPIAGQRFYLDHAQDDERGANTLIFSNTLRAQGIEHTYVINPVGGHRDSYWSGRLGDYLSFYSASLPFQIQEMPSCQE